MAIIGHVSNQETSIKGSDAAHSAINSEVGHGRVLIWSLNRTSGSPNGLASPTTHSFGQMTQSMEGLNYVPKANWPHQGYGWGRLIFTSRNKPYVQWAFANEQMNNYGTHGPGIEKVIDTLFASRSVWGSGNSLASDAKAYVRCCAGSSGSIGSENMQFQHNNQGNENFDIPTFGFDNGAVWGSGMLWGCIDNYTNYGGLLNTITPHIGSSGGATGDTLEIWWDPYYPKANDYYDFFATSETKGKSENYTWSTSTSQGSGGDPKYVARQTDRFTSANWDSHGVQRQHYGGAGYIQVDLGAGNEQSFDYTFAIGYPGASHMCLLNSVQASNDGSNWTEIGHWRSHNGGGAGGHSGTAGKTARNNNSTGASNKDEGYDQGYLMFNYGSNVYSNTINHVMKWVPLKETTTAYRYWRLSGVQWNTGNGAHGNGGGSNGYQLVINWALLKKKDVIDQRGSWQRPFTSLADADAAGAPDGMYWFINPLGEKEHLFVAQFDDEKGFPTNSGSRWALVSSNNGGDRKIDNGTNKNNNTYRLGRNGDQSWGIGNPDADFIVGNFIEQFKFEWCKIYGWGYDEMDEYSLSNNAATFKYKDDNALAVTWRPGAGENQKTHNNYSPNGLNSRTENAWCNKHTNWDNGMYNFTYAVVDSVRMDGGLNANSNQSTLGGSCNGNGDPSDGCHIGHGSSGGSGEGWYAGDSQHRDCQGYTTWVR